MPRLFKSLPSEDDFARAFLGSGLGFLSSFGFRHSMYVVVILAAALSILLLTTLLIAWWHYVRMPGRRFRGTVPPLDDHERRLCDELRRDLLVLAGEIGERNVSCRYAQLIAAAEWIESQLVVAGYPTRRQEFEVNGQLVWNIEAERTGDVRAEEVLVVGSHFDTVPGSPGANDNGSAVVMNLALARSLAPAKMQRTVRFVFFVNEEAPYFMTPDMGALRYAEQCRRRKDKVVGMISLETLGHYDSEPGSQRYPHPVLGWLYPTTGNFVGFVGNRRSGPWIRELVAAFRPTRFPCEGIAAPEFLRDIFRSDHSAFWHCGYPALMATDTANFRYAHYHTADDTPDKIDYEALARITKGLQHGLLRVAKTEPDGTSS